MGGSLTLFEHPDFAKYRTNKYKPGSTVLITGASSGLGKLIALKYAERGCPLVISGRNKEALAEVKKECQSKYNNNNVSEFICEATDEEQCK